MSDFLASQLISLVYAPQNTSPKQFCNLREKLSGTACSVRPTGQLVIFSPLVIFYEQMLFHTGDCMVSANTTTNNAESDIFFRSYIIMQSYRQVFLIYHYLHLYVHVFCHESSYIVTMPFYGRWKYKYFKLLVCGHNYKLHYFCG